MKRNQMIEGVNEDGCVDVAGVSVSLFVLFKKVAPLGGLQIKLTNFDWLKVARMLQLPGKKFIPTAVSLYLCVCN